MFQQFLDYIYVKGSEDDFSYAYNIRQGANDL